MAESTKLFMALPLSTILIWQYLLGLSALSLGQFDDNLTIEGLDEGRLCISDQ